MRIVIFTLSFFFILSSAFGLTLEKAVLLAIQESVRINGLKANVDLLESQKSQLYEDGNEKLYINVNGQRDARHLSDPYINDLFQQNYIDYSFNQTNYSLTYERRLFDNQVEDWAKMRGIESSNKELERKNLLQTVGNQVRLLFTEINYLKKEKDVLREKMGILAVLKKMDTGKYASGRVSLDDLGLIQVKENYTDQDIRSTEESISRKVKILSTLVNQPLLAKEIEIKDEHDLFDLHWVERDFSGMEKVFQEITENNLKKQSLAIDGIKNQNRLLDYQFGVKYFSGNNIVTASVYDAKSFKLTEALTDNYGTEGFYKGFYGNNPEEGALYFFNLTLNILGNSQKRDLEAQKNQGLKDQFEYFRINQEVQKNYFDQKAAISSGQISIGTHEKNIQALKKGFDVSLQKFRAGTIDLERVLNYEDQLFQEKTDVYRENISISERIFSIYQTFLDYHPSGY